MSSGAALAVLMGRLLSVGVKVSNQALVSLAHGNHRRLTMAHTDGNVYAWHRDTGTLLEVLPGSNEGSVNAISWNPINERMFASCADDRTVRIWEAPHSTHLEPRIHRVDGIENGMTNGKGKGKL